MISTGRTEEMRSSLDCSMLPISSLELDPLVNTGTWEEFIPVFGGINGRAGIRSPSLVSLLQCSSNWTTLHMQA